MSENYYPPVHLFLLKCAESGDFSGQYKHCFLSLDIAAANSIAEEVENLSASLLDVDAAVPFLLELDPDTLNYVLDTVFLKRYRAVHSFIDNIDDISFESLCALYVNLLGCNNFRVTRRSSDQGLDFYGTLPIAKHSYFGALVEKSFLIGQAKLYRKKVGTGEIREFVGSLELLRRRIYSSETYAYEFATEIKHYSLIHPIFISSSSYTRDAQELCNKIGIRMVDIVKLIVLITTVDKLFTPTNKLKKNSFEKLISGVKHAKHI